MRAFEIYESQDDDDDNDPTDEIYNRWFNSYGKERRQLRAELKQKYQPFIEQVTRLGHLWDSYSAEQLAQVMPGSLLFELPHTEHVQALVHTSAFDDGIPVLKYFDRGLDRYPKLNGADYEECTIPAGSKVIYDSENDTYYGFAPGHGFARFDLDETPPEVTEFLNPHG
jgi:hypothetical protein